MEPSSKQQCSVGDKASVSIRPDPQEIRHHSTATALRQVKRGNTHSATPGLDDHLTVERIGMSPSRWQFGPTVGLQASSKPHLPRWP